MFPTLTKQNKGIQPIMVTWKLRCLPTGWGPSSLAKLVYKYIYIITIVYDTYNLQLYLDGVINQLITGGPHPV